VCARERERERERECVCVCVQEREKEKSCVCACVRAREKERGNVCVSEGVCFSRQACTHSYRRMSLHGVATISRLLKIVGLFCKRDL